MSEIPIPPTVSPRWTVGERLAVIEWITAIFQHRIACDDPTVPLLAKAPVVELFRAIAFLTTETAAELERYRDILLKPYDPSRNFAGVLVPDEMLKACRK